jgi:teichuronic acid biosynthesis glycosyltransferase TuaG
MEMDPSGREPDVSVVIPSYNMEKHILETLKSVSTQTLDNFEVIVVDDCSSDSTPDIVRRHMTDDPRFRLVVLEQNSNRPAVPRNRGICEARGAFVAFLDHDDLWAPWKLQRQFDVMSAYPDLGMVHSAMWLYPGKKSYSTLLDLPNPLHRSSLSNLRRWNAISCSSVMARRAVVNSVGGFDESPKLRAIEDYHLWLRIANQHSFAFITEIHGFYRTDPESTYALEAMDDRLAFLRTIGLIDPAASTPLSGARALARAMGYPAAVYRYLVDGPIRRRIGSLAHIV